MPCVEGSLPREMPLLVCASLRRQDCLLCGGFSSPATTNKQREWWSCTRVSGRCVLWLLPLFSGIFVTGSASGISLFWEDAWLFNGPSLSLTRKLSLASWVKPQWTRHRPINPPPVPLHQDHSAVMVPALSTYFSLGHTMLRKHTKSVWWGTVQQAN